MRKSIGCISFFGTLALSSVSLAAEPVTYAPAPEGRALSVLEDAKVTGQAPMPCRPNRIYRYDATRIVSTCEDKPGLLVIDVAQPNTPLAVEILGYDGKLLDVYLVGNTVWIDLQGQGSIPLQLTPSTSSTKPAIEEKPMLVGEETPDAEEPKESIGTLTSESPKYAAIGTVLKFENRDVFISLGTNDGFKKGDSVEFFERLDVELTNENTTKDETVALGKIKSITANRSVIEVELNQVIKEGTSVRHSREEFKPNYFNPARNPGLTEYVMTVRPFIALGALGGGAIVDASVTHRFEFPMAIQFSLSPLGLAATNEGGTGTFAAHGFVTYDARVFQVGLGAGLSRFDLDDLPSEIFVGQTIPETTAIGFSVGQFVRLGAHDGLNFTATTNFVVRNMEFDFGGMSGSLQVPMSQLLADTWFIVRGGGGVPGHVFGEVGLRTLILGNGNKGSFFITPTLGAANLTAQEYGPCDFGEAEQCRDSVDYGGPMVGATLEWRP
jgi:hypothetical protein